MPTGANLTGALTGRVREALEARIASGSLAPGQQLPTERELSETFGVSRVTVRRAIASLTESGLVHAIQGRGTFVDLGTSGRAAQRACSASTTWSARHVAVSSQAIEATVRPATISEAEDFQIAPGAELFALERLRMLDDLPVALDFTLVPVALEPALPGLDWEVASLYSALADSRASAGCGRLLGRGATSRRPRGPTAGDCRRHAPARGRLENLRPRRTTHRLRSDLLPRRPLPLPQPTDGRAAGAEVVRPRAGGLIAARPARSMRSAECRCWHTNWYYW